PHRSLPRCPRPPRGPGRPRPADGPADQQARKTHAQDPGAPRHPAPFRAGRSRRRPLGEKTRSHRSDCYFEGHEHGSRTRRSGWRQPAGPRSRTGRRHGHDRVPRRAGRCRGPGGPPSHRHDRHPVGTPRLRDRAGGAPMSETTMPHSPTASGDSAAAPARDAGAAFPPPASSRLTAPHASTPPSPRSSAGAAAPKYLLATYGCQMNEYDSNLVGAMLEKRGMSITENPDEADLFVVNTCSIRGGAEDKAYARVAALRHHKRHRPGVRIAVIGCMAQNHGEKIPVALEHVDYVVGPDGYGALEGMLFGEGTDDAGRPVTRDRDAAPVVWTEQNDFENYEGMIARLDGSVSAHVTIMRGCNKRCTYCIVPNVRGVERSRSADEVIAEVRHIVSQGVQEV